MPELDDAQIRTTLEEVVDAAAAEVDVDARLVELHARVGKGRTNTRWRGGFLAAAAVVAVVAGSVAVFADRDAGQQVLTGPQEVDTTPEPDVVTAHEPDAAAMLERAAQATLDAPGWVVVVAGGASLNSTTYRAPDRVLTAVDNGDGFETIALVAGSDAWAIDDGNWVRVERDYQDNTPFVVLDTLLRACAARIDEGILAWDGSMGCERPFENQPVGTNAYLATVEDGRIARVDLGQVAAEPPAEDLPPHGLNRLDQFNVIGPVYVTFRYDDVPEVTVPPEALAATTAAEELDDLMSTAFTTLGWELAQCCNLPGDIGGAQAAVHLAGARVPLDVSPVEQRIYELDGAPAVFVHGNDYVTDARPVELGSAAGVAGTADGYPFAAFTCGGYLWTVGGLFGGESERLPADLVAAAATELAVALECEPGDRPVARGHGDPHG